jgi:outer membrane protein assembly factor BamB
VDAAAHKDGPVAEVDAGAPVAPAVTFQIDPAHSGGQPGSALRPPLKHRWSVTLGSKALSYPLIVGDAVFLTGSGSNGGKLYALSAVDGSTLWGPIDLGSNAFGSAADAAWDAGKVFTMNGTGLLSAYDASTGEPLWSRTIDAEGSIEVGAPVAVNGRVYAAPGGALHALDESSGGVLWSGAYGGSPTSPAYVPGHLVLESINGTMTDLDPATGSKLWHTMGCCTGGGGEVPVIYMGRIFARDFWQDPNVIADLQTGNTLGSFSASTIPAFENGLGFFLGSQTLEGRDVNGMVKWSFAGDQMLASTPLAAGGYVYVGSKSGTLFAVDEQTGRMVWSDQLGAPVAPANETNGLAATAGLGASLDLLVVPAGSTVTAYENDTNPLPELPLAEPPLDAGGSHASD